jgi:hypothetical protein
MRHPEAFAFAQHLVTGIKEIAFPVIAVDVNAGKIVYGQKIQVVIVIQIDERRRVSVAKPWSVPYFGSASAASV